MYVNCLVKWSNRLEDILRLSGWGNLPPSPNGNKQVHTFFITLYDLEYIYVTF